MEIKLQDSEEKNPSFLDSYLTPGIKIKIKNLTGHLEDIPNHILEYHLSTI